MKLRHWITAILILAILAGLSLMLYPTVSNYIESLSHRRVISEYVTSVESMDEADYAQLLADAQEYNRNLAKLGGSMRYLPEEAMEEYQRQLCVDAAGVMGYLHIPSLSLSLPIYHGTTDEVLQVGVGHLEGSSLPVGGAGTHTVLSGHRGLPSAKLFTDLDKLEIGDIFSLRVLGDTLSYEVDQIRVVEPFELDSLAVEKGEDYCTLVTCTPYGVNTHRLLVRGHRIPTPEEEQRQVENEEISVRKRTLGMDRQLFLLILCGAAVLFALLFVGTVVLLHRRRRKRRSRNNQEKEK